MSLFKQTTFALEKSARKTNMSVEADSSKVILGRSFKSYDCPIYRAATTRARWNGYVSRRNSGNNLHGAISIILDRLNLYLSPPHLTKATEAL